VAGFGLAFLQLRKSVGANNVLLGFDVPYWATGDFISTNTEDDIQPHVDSQFAFLSALGLGANATGQTFDFVATNPLGADFDWYRLDLADNGNQSQNLWWDPRDTAPITSRSFNRYAQWLSLFNKASSLRWLLWQIPMGNSNSPNVDNTNGASVSNQAAGWKDNRPEYFFCSESNRHLGQFADAGVIALLFGAGGTGCTDQTSDYYPNGQLFLQSHAGAIVNSGGFPLSP
jgi:YHS domain-containing protein